MTNSLRDTIRAQARTGLTLWVPALAGWLLLYWGSANMASPAAQLTMPMSDWSAANFIAVFIMWTVMMAAMMLPSATPMVTVFGTLNERRGEALRTVAFVAGYVALWAAFGAAATAAQWALQRRGLLSPMIVSMSPAFNGALRMGARHGLYCLGCCWALMALLFVGGVMNLMWIAALTLLVAMEKLAPKGEILARALGVLMLAAGAVRLIWRP